MSINEDLSELIGVFIGDGCLSRWKRRDSYVSALVFTGNLKNDYKYYEYLRSIIKQYFRIKKSIRKRKNFNAIELKFYDKNIIDFFISLGFRFGKKKDIEIPLDILDNDQLSKACIRGIFNTDGSVYKRYSRRYFSNSYLNYAVIEIRNNSDILLNQIKYVLENDGFNINKITKDKTGCSTLRINNQDDVERFFREIAITHEYHKYRFLVIKNKFLKYKC